jgi:hypothetical protein
VADVSGGSARIAVVALLALTGVSFAEVRPAAAQQGGWTVPRLADGTPDLQGNWSNATMTPIQRPPGLELILTPDQVAALEDGRQDFIQESRQDSDADRDAPPVGGAPTGDALFDAGGGEVGQPYNYFFIDAGDAVAIYDGQPRSSLIVEPIDGRRPPLSEEGQRRAEARRAFNAQFGSYDNPENRPLAERCMMSFGSNGGPPMLPNYFYNNNYTIVQTPDHVMIMTEMVHDVRIVRMGEPRRLPEHVRPWMGDSWGRWEGETLVIETTNIHPEQRMLSISLGGEFYPSEEIVITERLTRVSETKIHYEFLIEDPIVLSAPLAGEVPFNRLDGLVYEYACHEGNYAMENVLRGARSQESSERNENERR